jgi:hypothetical protein
LLEAIINGHNSKAKAIGCAELVLVSAGAECRHTASTEWAAWAMRNPRYKKLIIKGNRPPRASLSNQIAR